MTTVKTDNILIDESVNCIKWLTADKHVRLVMVDVTEALKDSRLEAVEHPSMQYLFQSIYTNLSLMRGFIDTRQRIHVTLRFQNDAYTVRGDVNGDNNVHCVFSPDLNAYGGTVTDLFRDGATLSVTRGSTTGGLFTSTVPVTSPSPDDWFTSFYAQSDQTNTVFHTWVDPRGVRGWALQPLPFAHHDKVRELAAKLRREEATLREHAWPHIADYFSPWATVIERQRVHSQCQCSKPMFLGMLASVDTAILKEAIAHNVTERAQCGVCGRTYTLTPNDLRSVLKELTET